MASTPSSSSPSTSSSSVPAPAWVLLDRAPRVPDSDAAEMEMDGDADVVLRLVKPPAVSSAYLSRALLLDGAATDRDTAACRVEGADASGRLLLAFPAPRAPGESNLAVCRPLVSGTSGGEATAKGRAAFLPAFPEEKLGYAISTAAPAGIIIDVGAICDDAYIVAQLQRAPAPAVAVALCFASDKSEWTAKDVAGDHLWRDFAAKYVVSHDRGVDGGGSLVFVDTSKGLLLFRPRAMTSQFIQFPDPPMGDGGGEVDHERASVDSTDGRIVYVAFSTVEEGEMVGLWWLSEDQLRWTPGFNHILSDEVLSRLLPLQPVRSVGPVDPNWRTRVFLTLGSPGDAAACCLVEMTPDRVRLLGIGRCGSLAPALLCPVSSDPSKSRGWAQTIREAIDEGFELVPIGLHLLDKCRQLVDPDQLAAAAEILAALNLPITATLVTSLGTASRTIGTVETLYSLVQEARRTGAPPPRMRTETVGTAEEALRAIALWEICGKPADMHVLAAPGVTVTEMDNLRKVFMEAGAEDLLKDGDEELVKEYVLVERAPRFC